EVDGTREAARQRALPQTADRPTPQRRLRPLCAPATRDANEEKWCAAGPRFCRRIRISFSARLETPAMGNTEQNCVGQSRPYKATERPITTLKNVFCCASTGNMAREPSSLISLGCLL